MKNLSIRAKLLFATVPPLIVLIFAVSFFSVQMHNVFDQAEGMFYDSLYHINSNLINGDRDFYQSFQASTKIFNLAADNALIKDQHAELLDDYESNAQQVYDNTHAAIDQAKTDSLLWTGITAEMGITFEQCATEFDNAYQVWRDSYNPADGKVDEMVYVQNSKDFSAARDYINEMQDITTAWSEIEHQQIEASINRTIMITIIVFAIIIVLVVAFVIYVIRAIRKGINTVTDDIEVLAKNDLSHDEPVVDSTDEIGKMKKAFVEMQRNLTSVVTTLQNTSDGLSDACKIMNDNTDSAGRSMQDINSAAGELARTATSQAEDVDDVAKNMDDLSGVMERSVKTAEDLGHASNDISNVTKEGASIVDDLTNINEQSLEAFNSIFESIDNIQASADKISEASELIQGIAEQTNLLSLNASIEAARAGDAGKGFAVVAEEIRNLSDESAGNVQTINELLAELQENTKGAISKSTLVKEYVEKQNNSVAETKDSFDKIVGSVGTVEQAIREIESINSELKDRIDTVSQRVQNLSAASEENAATAEELSATSDVVTRNVEDLVHTQKTVDASAEELTNIVALFTMKDGVVEVE
ncbi:MAG: methyl-accepting chemotaxis protein [Lachnospiraceae bacterium]|nr:methyl-accepting chemotaxis protein [Lachnospiraceae bacterium]